MYSVCIWTLKYIKWKIWFEEKTLSLFRTFEVIKIGLYSYRLSHFSLEIFEFVWCVNNSTGYVTLRDDFLGIKYIFGIISLHCSVVCWVICCGYIHTHEQFQVTLFDNIRDIPDFPKSHYAVWRMRWSYLDIKQIKISQDWNEIRDNPTAVKTNLYNFKRSMK